MDIPFDILRHIMIYYIDHNIIIYNKLVQMNSSVMRHIVSSIKIRVPKLFALCTNNNKVLECHIINDCNYVSNDGITPLIYACKTNRDAIALQLLKFNCKPNYVDNENNTALIYACKNSMTKVALELLNQIM